MARGMRAAPRTPLLLLLAALLSGCIPDESVRIDKKLAYLIVLLACGLAITLIVILAGISRRREGDDATPKDPP